MKDLFDIVIIAIGLSFDTFAVSISTGLAISTIQFKQGVRIALVLAIFQGFMPLLGWLGGKQIANYIADYDHWLAFVLLGALGIKMIVEAFSPEEEKSFNPLITKVLIGIAIATSIDALVVGVTLAFIEVNILLALGVIGFITFLAAMIGMLLGKKVQNHYGKKIEIMGGLILFGIGLKILISHLS